jgi:hypothetical protein
MTSISMQIRRNRAEELTRGARTKSLEVMETLPMGVKPAIDACAGAPSHFS